MTRLGDFWKFWVTNLLTKVAQNITDFFGLFWKWSLYVITAVAFIQAIFVNICTTIFTPISGHTASYVITPKSPALKGPPVSKNPWLKYQLLRCIFFLEWIGERERPVKADLRRIYKVDIHQPNHHSIDWVSVPYFILIQLMEFFILALSLALFHLQITVPYRNKAFWLDVPSNMTIFTQSDSILLIDWLSVPYFTLIKLMFCFILALFI